MAHKATDVVLLPDKTTTDRAIEINRQIVREFSAKIALNETDCLPHISLAMGCIEEQDVGKIRGVLERIAKDMPIGQLTAVGIQTPANSRGEETALLEIERTRELQALHERVMEEMKHFFRHDARDDMFYDETVAESSLEWVRNYPEKAAYDQFRPHITLGYGQVKSRFSLPMAFRATRLALCHLGNHCTCRRVLTEVRLD